ncbi:MAG: YjzC family protein [Ruminiclostridium sp.]
MPKKTNNKPLTPGTKAPKSGQAVEVGSRGGNPGKTEVTLVQGKKVPPTSAPGRKVQIVDETKHKKK